MPELTPFHIAFPVDDLDAARRFYGGVLGCPEGRSAEGEWIDFDLFGHQIVAHYVPGASARLAGHNPVDGHDVPLVDRVGRWSPLVAGLPEEAPRHTVRAGTHDHRPVVQDSHQVSSSSSRGMTR